MGKVFGIHEIELKPGVTEADLRQHLRDSTFSIPGLTTYVAKGDRGARTDKYVAIIEFESAELRARYFPSTGEPSEEWNRLVAPFVPVIERFTQLTTWPDPNFTDYHVLDLTE